MHQPFHSSHDFAPQSLRYNGRIKDGSEQTQDCIRWVRPRFDATLAMITKKIRFDADLVSRLKPATN